MIYSVKMHNGDNIEIDAEKATKLKKILLQDNRPEYIEIDDTLVKLQTIASVVPKKKAIF